MARSIISKLLAFLTLFIVAIQATPITGSSALELRTPPETNPEDCLPPLLLCDKACCSPNSLCGPTGLCKPGPSNPASTAWISYTNDAQGRPTVINVNGANFHKHGTTWIQFAKNGFGFSAWEKNPITAKNFAFNTSFQDCTKTGKSSSKTDGYPGEVVLLDIIYTGDGYETYLLRKFIPVRVTESGICP